jgi:hypothetical protein
LWLLCFATRHPGAFFISSKPRMPRLFAGFAFSLYGGCCRAGDDTGQHANGSYRKSTSGYEFDEVFCQLEHDCAPWFIFPETKTASSDANVAFWRERNEEGIPGIL